MLTTEVYKSQSASSTATGRFGMRGFCECCESDRKNTLHSYLHHQTGLFCHFGGTCDTNDIYVVLTLQPWGIHHISLDTGTGLR